MKIAIPILLLSICCASAVLGVIDPCPNDMGIYFDLNADVYECTAPLYMIMPTYVILTQPDFDTLIGFEFSYEMTGNAVITETTFAGSEPTDASETAYNHIVSLASPLPTGNATLLATASVFIFDADPIAFTLRGAEPNSIDGSSLPAVVLPGDELRIIGLSAWDRWTLEPATCAILNGVGVPLSTLRQDCLLDVSTDPITWDAIKSMYR